MTEDFTTKAQRGAAAAAGAVNSAVVAMSESSKPRVPMRDAEERNPAPQGAEPAGGG